jgi:hypothetical protein
MHGNLEQPTYLEVSELLFKLAIQYRLFSCFALQSRAALPVLVHSLKEWREVRATRAADVFTAARRPARASCLESEQLKRSFPCRSPAGTRDAALSGCAKGCCGRGVDHEGRRRPRHSRTTTPGREPRICYRTAQPALPPSAWGTCWWVSRTGLWVWRLCRADRSRPRTGVRSAMPFTAEAPATLTCTMGTFSAVLASRKKRCTARDRHGRTAAPRAARCCTLSTDCSET